LSRDEAHDLWRRYVNPDHVELLEALDFGRRFVRAEGTKLYDESGRAYTDFLAGYGVHSLGHNPPRVVAALREALEAGGPSMLNVDAPIEAGRLAERLSAMTRPELCRAVFANSGAEAVDAAIKAARAATGRRTVLSCQNGYHGLSVGAISLIGDEGSRRAFSPLLAETAQVPFGDLAALEAACARAKPAAFFVEPIQGEGGIRVPPAGYLREASRICRAHGVLLVLDEIQTGLGRTGAEFATDFAELCPDALLVGKALSGGLIPVAAALLTAEVWERAFSGPERCHLVTSTFAGNRLAMTAGLEVLAVLHEEGLASRAGELGGVLLEGCRELARRQEMIRDVRGRGLLIGIEFQKPSGLLLKAVPSWAREGLYAQVVSALLLHEHGFLTQPCSLAENVLRLEPPLVVAREEIDRFLEALDQALTKCPSPNSAVFAVFRKKILGGRM